MAGHAVAGASAAVVGLVQPQQHLRLFPRRCLQAGPSVVLFRVSGPAQDGRSVGSRCCFLPLLACLEDPIPQLQLVAIVLSIWTLADPSLRPPIEVQPTTLLPAPLLDRTSNTPSRSSRSEDAQSSAYGTNGYESLARSRPGAEDVVLVSEIGLVRAVDFGDP